MNSSTPASRLALAISLMALLCFTDVLWSGAPRKPQTIARDAKIQATIQRVAAAMEEGDNDYRQGMKELTEMARKTPDVLVGQLIYAVLHEKREKESWAIIILMCHFGTQWSSEVRGALIPLLEGDRSEVYREVTRWLHNIDGDNRPGPETNIMFYREVLLRKKEAPPRGLVNYVFDLDRGKALLLFGEIYSERPKFGEPPRALLWSEHVITTVKWRLLKRFLQEGDLEKARKELDTLSKHEGWYARRYAVETIRDIPKFGTSDMIDRLKKDTNPLVAEAARLIK